MLNKTFSFQSNDSLWRNHLIDRYLKKSSIQGLDFNWFSFQSLLKRNFARVDQVMCATSLCIFGNLWLLSHVILDKSNYKVSGRFLVLLIAFALESKLCTHLHPRLNDDCFNPRFTFLADSVPIESDSLALITHTLDWTIIELHDGASKVHLDIFWYLWGWCMASTVSGAEHASREFLSSGITHLMEGIVMQEEFVEDLIAVLLVDVATLITTWLIPHSQS